MLDFICYGSGPGLVLVFALAVVLSIGLSWLLSQGQEV